MAGVLSNLYPPIVETQAPAFAINQANSICRVYFSLSPFNSLNEIKNAQATVRYQKTNTTALSKRLYPTGVKICPINTDNTRRTDDKYYINISSEDMEAGFQIGQYYKVQIRFTGIQAQDPPTVPAIDMWLVNNSQYFSEWSRICLIRGISQPVLNLMGLPQDSEGPITLSQTTLSLIGSLDFSNNKEVEKLKFYRARLYDEESKLLSDSGTVYANSGAAANEINYVFKYLLEDGNKYKLVFNYTTQNNYSEELLYDLIVIQNALEKLKVNLSAESYAPMGRINIKTNLLDIEPFIGMLMFRRSSSESHFLVWEDIHLATFTTGVFEYSWSDNTVESGTYYKYCVQEIDIAGNRGVVTILDEPIMVLFEDMFLSAEGKHLRLRFNPEVSSYRRSVIESKVDTIGSKYPFIKRNGEVSYYHYPVSALISMHMDDNEEFASLLQLGDHPLTREQELKYRKDQRVNEYNDYIYEREFRELVEDFLYKNNVKLMRTMTEGNRLVKLMDISFTPEHTLGRMLYSFSANAYEIEECILDNIFSHAIDGGDLAAPIEKQLSREEELALLPKIFDNQKIKVGTLYATFEPNKDVISNTLAEKYQGAAGVNHIVTIDGLDGVQLEIESPPYLIKEGTANELLPLGDNETPNEKTVLGYIVRINGVDIYINPEGIYELGSDINVSSLSFPKRTKVSINYTARVIEKKDEAATAFTDIFYYYNKVGQIWGTFEYQDSVIRQIASKYLINYKAYSQKLVSVNGIKIQAMPDTVCWIQDSTSRDMKRFIVNDTGLLSYFDDTVVIEGLYFSGLHLSAAGAYSDDIVLQHKFFDTGIAASSFEEIKNPLPNGVYTITNTDYIVNLGNLNQESSSGVKLITDSSYALLLTRMSEESNKFIYFNDSWHLFTTDNDVLCSVDGIVDYWCEVEQAVHTS